MERISSELRFMDTEKESPIVTVDQATQSLSRASSASALRWKWCGEAVPREEIVFFTQMILALSVIVSSIVCLSMQPGGENKEFWMVMLSGCMGYIMPSPNMKVTQSKLPFARPTRTP